MVSFSWPKKKCQLQISFTILLECAFRLLSIIYSLKPRTSELLNFATSSNQFFTKDNSLLVAKFPCAMFCPTGNLSVKRKAKREIMYFCDQTLLRFLGFITLSAS